MPDGNDQAPWQTAASGIGGQADKASLASRTTAKIPPPPSDIAIRTLASDLKSMHETGGSHPKPNTISINIPEGLEIPSQISKIPGSSALNRSSAQSVIYLIAGIVLVIVLTAAALFLLKK